LGPHVLVPDLAGWRRERMPTLPTAAWFELPPDWICKVLSVSTTIVDRTQKQEAYRRQDIPWMWFVDPAGIHDSDGNFAIFIGWRLNDRAPVNRLLTVPLIPSAPSARRVRSSRRISLVAAGEHARTRPRAGSTSAGPRSE
jgi:hypothetical protein